MSASLVGSEMCIRDRLNPRPVALASEILVLAKNEAQRKHNLEVETFEVCLLYTSDAADDM
eukprot:11053357-Alexandrium_andersonii.AAC.1